MDDDEVYVTVVCCRREFDQFHNVGEERYQPQFMDGMVVFFGRGKGRIYVSYVGHS